jgi:hypothetical protein
MQDKTPIISNGERHGYWYRYYNDSLWTANYINGKECGLHTYVLRSNDRRFQTYEYYAK